VSILNEHIELLLLLIVEHGKYYELEERGDTVRQTCYLYGSEGLFVLVIRTDGRDSVRYCHRDHLGSGEGLMTLGGSLKTGAKIAVQSVVGGTLSELGGGNFANGAITAAFLFMFNHLKHFIHTHDDDSAPGIKIANEANRNLGSKKWSKWLKPIGPKCSIFVQDILHSLGYYDGVFRQAGIWGDPSIEIDGWIQIPYDEVQCGDIAAYKEKTSDASGHMGIMFYSNSKQNWTLIYAGSSQHPEQVVRSLFFVPSMPGRKSWFEQHNWIFRRYLGK